MITHIIRTQNVTYQGLNKDADQVIIMVVCSCGWQEEVEQAAVAILDHKIAVLSQQLNVAFVIGKPLPDFVHPE